MSSSKQNNLLLLFDHDFIIIIIINASMLHHMALRHIVESLHSTRADPSCTYLHLLLIIGKRKGLGLHYAFTVLSGADRKASSDLE